jgi:hypothetical protein
LETFWPLARNVAKIDPRIFIWSSFLETFWLWLAVAVLTNLHTIGFVTLSGWLWLTLAGFANLHRVCNTLWLALAGCGSPLRFT